MDSLWWLVPGLFVVAALYASVGHGGASGYLALLSLAPAALAPDHMATTALTLNLVVAGMGWLAFARAGHFVGRLTWPFLATSVPAAFVGGVTPVSVRVYAVLLAGSLLVAALRLVMAVRRRKEDSMEPPAWAVAAPVGAGIGWLSGVVGVGGGIFLSPLLLLLRWAHVKQTAATSACFILVNSAAGLAGRFTRGAMDYGTLWPLLMAAFGGGLVGSRLGAHHFSGALLRRLLAVVLLVASLKLLRMALVG
ncbi:MAG: sulfite exporter TauE/SafE family protein [Candidatus Omnitrophica bacterium]|nr:sulfite exporter TauE/SafE family protein [Candidatus Omnitrophota bacterium]